MIRDYYAHVRHFTRAYNPAEADALMVFAPFPPCQAV